MNNRRGQAPNMPSHMLALATALLLLGTSQQARAQTATYPVTGGTFDGYAFGNWLTSQHSNASITQVSLSPPGTYQVTNQYAGAGGSFIFFICYDSRTTPFTINLSGTTILGTSGVVSHMYIAYCTNVEVYGGTFAYTIPQRPIAQGTITAINSNTWTVQIHADYLASFQRMQTQFGNGNTYGVNTYDPTTLALKTYAYGTALNSAAVLSGGSVTSQGGNTYTMVVYSVYPNVGDYFTYRQPDNSAGITIFYSTTCTLYGVTIRQSSLTAIVDYYGTGGHTYQNVQIAPDPTPGSDGHPNIGTAGGDGIGVALPVNGPTIKNCVISYTGDDSIEISGHFFTIAGSNPSAKTLLIAASTSGLTIEYYPGDTIKVYSFPTWQILGTATVAAAPVQTTEPSSIPSNAVDQMLFEGSAMFSGYSYWTLTLTSFPFPTIPFNSIISNPSRAGTGSQVINNVFLNNRGRAVAMQAGNAVISGNTITNMGPLPAITYGPDNVYGEADFGNNAVISNNVINTLGGGVQVGGEFIFTGSYLMNNITISGNTIYNTQANTISVFAASNVNVVGNTLINNMCSATDSATYLYAYPWTHASQPFSFTNITGLTFTGNTLTQNSGCAVSMVNYGTPVFYSNVVNSQLQTFQTYDTLAPGACIPQGTQLFSANGLYYLTPQNDGDLVLYAVAGGGTFYSNSYQNAGAGPFQLCMQSNCDAEMINGAGQVIYSFGNIGRGSGNCKLQVTNAGQAAIIDSLGVTWSINGAPVKPANGQIAVGQQLGQSIQFFSADGAVFLYIIWNGQFNVYGDIILYNTALYNNYGALASGAMIWHSATLGTAAQQPFTLTMQEDCNLVEYNSNYLTNPPSYKNALWASGTYQPSSNPCHVVVSSANGGSLQVVDSTGKVVFQQPPAGTVQAPVDTLLPGRTLLQNYQLNSQNNNFNMIAQSDGNIVVYGNTSPYVFYASNVFPKAGQCTGPFSLYANTGSCSVQQFCNGSPTSVAFIADGLGRAPCSLQLTNAGQLALVDSIGATWTANMQLIAPTPTSGILPVGNVLQMNVPLYSTDGNFFLMVQSSGEVAVFNTALYATYGPSPLATAWRSQAFSSNAPFYLVVQDDCNIVEYDATLTTKFANNGATAFWASGTYGKSTVGAYDAGCKLYVVSNAGYGALYLNDGKGVNLWGTGGVVIPVADTLNYGSALHQGGRLYSANGLYYVTVQADANLLIYQAQGNKLVWSANSYQSNPSSLYPLTLAIQPNCDLTETTASGAVLYSFHNGGRGTPPCHAQIRNDGTLAIFDSLGVLWSVTGGSAGSPGTSSPARPVAGSNQITAGQALSDGANLYSPDGTAYLVAIYTGKVVLANAALAKNDPYFTNPATTIWQSGTSGGPDPLNLLMQEDCNLVLYNGNYLTQGPSYNTAIWSTATYGQGSGCYAQVNNGYTWSVVNSAGKTVFQAPAASG